MSRQGQQSLTVAVHSHQPQQRHKKKQSQYITTGKPHGVVEAPLISTISYVVSEGLPMDDKNK